MIFTCHKLFQTGSFANTALQRGPGAMTSPVCNTHALDLRPARCHWNVLSIQQEDDGLVRPPLLSILKVRKDLWVGPLCHKDTVYEGRKALRCDGGGSIVLKQDPLSGSSS